MAYVPVPKDLSRIKTKVAFNLTKRQLIFFAVALLAGLPLFFLLKGSTGTSLAAFVMILAMPCVFKFQGTEFREARRGLPDGETDVRSKYLPAGRKPRSI